MDGIKKTEGGQVILSYDRVLVCLEAAWELDALARVLPGLVPCVADGAPDPHFVVRAMAGRLLRLSGVLMGMADNEAADDLVNVIDLQSGQG